MIFADNWTPWPDKMNTKAYNDGFTAGWNKYMWPDREQAPKSDRHPDSWETGFKAGEAAASYADDEAIYDAFPGAIK